MIFYSENLNVVLIESGIAELCFNHPHTVNKLDLKTLQSLGEALTILQKQKDIKALLITSHHPAFIVGADIKSFLTLFAAPAKQLRQWLKKANAIFNQLEDLPFPTIACIRGYALGGGCECILAADFRIADTSAQIGLPETQLGIMPGFGGSVRLPRIIGADPAIEWITTGQTYSAKSAFSVGVLDAVTSPKHLISSGLKLAKELIKGEIDWHKRRTQKQLPLMLNQNESAMCFDIAKRQVKQISGSHYIAPLTAVIAIEAAATHGRKKALNIEHQHFIELAQTSIAQALVGLFLNEQAIKTKNKLASSHISLIETIGVIGAGIMGGGIAYQAANKKIKVILKDINSESLHTGVSEAARLFHRQYLRGKIDSLEMAKRLSHIEPELNDQKFSRTSVVIEAVTEDPKIKVKVLPEAERFMPKDSILVSNTSTIPISRLAESVKRPANFCGMHFFNPVHRMPLVEIIRGKKTSSQTIQIVTALASKMGKKSIVVNDCPGFFVNRVLFPYFAAFSLLIDEGISHTQIDQVMEQVFGWPMGPAYLIDIIGIDTVHHAQKVMARGYPARMAKKKSDCIDILIKAQRLGQKNHKGFYRYQMNKKGKLEKQIDSELPALLAPLSQHTFTNQIQAPTEESIMIRMMIPMIHEVIRCLDEKIIASPEEADMALIYGLGFPTFRGGVFRYLDTLGIQTYLTLASPYQHLGPLYQIPESLKQKAQQGKGFYDWQIQAEPFDEKEQQA